MTSKATKCSKGQFYRRGYVRHFPRIKRVQPTCVKRSKRSSKTASKRRKSNHVCNSKFVANYSKQCDENMHWRRGHCRPSSGTYVPGQCVKIAKSYLGPYMVTSPSIQPQVFAPSSPSSTTFIPTSLPQQQPQVFAPSKIPTVLLPQRQLTTAAVTQPQLPLQTIKTIQKPTTTPAAATPYQEEIIIITGPPQAAF